jgi:hypothetical protein
MDKKELREKLYKKRLDDMMKIYYDDIDKRQRKIEAVKFTNGFITAIILMLVLIFTTNLVKADTGLLIKNCLMEAENQSMEAKIAVTHVVLNRAKNPKFPNTIEGVVLQPKQFSWVKKPSQRIIRYKDYKKCEKAVQLALSCVNKNNFLYYWAASGPNAIKEPKWAQNLKNKTQIDAHMFASED